MVKIYVAHAMSGRAKRSVLKESAAVAACAGFWRNAGHDVRLLDPVIVENIKDEPGKIDASVGDITQFWKRDKEMIREAHVLIDLTGPRKSEGVAHEIGYARFGLWKPVIRVYPKLAANSVARFEDDFIVDNIEEALSVAVGSWGTFPKRLVWRLKMLNRSVPRWLKYQLQEFK